MEEFDLRDVHVFGADGLGNACRALRVEFFHVDFHIVGLSMFASHTLIAYPIISKLGITKDKAVGITVGGTDDHGYVGIVGVDGDCGDGRGRGG